MHRHWLDADSPPATSAIHRAPAPLKMAAAITLVLALVSLPHSWVLYAITAATLLALIIFSHVHIKSILRRLLVAEPFVLCVAILTLFQPHGLHAFASLLTSSTLCVITLILLTAVTPFSDMLDVMKRARVPHLMVTTIALMYRYLHVLVDESRRMRIARASRTFTPTRRLAWSAVSSVISQLFVRASTRSERIYAAMCSRGWE